ncbi:MAG: hypothetical protein IPM64_06770 [Phycisphaerales bacterium]|nr:hypothetical protein [Phycisphaerales bacterium]
MPQAATLAVDSQGRVAGDMACWGCRYNLRMTPAEGLCPECGMSVKDSIRGQRAAMHRGAWRLIWGARILAVVGVLGVAGLVLMTSGALDGNRQSRSVQILLAWMLREGLLLMMVIGFLLMTTRVEWVATRRQWPRRVLIVALLAVLGGLLTTTYSYWTLFLGPPGFVATTNPVFIAVLPTNLYTKWGERVVWIAVVVLIFATAYSGHVAGCYGLRVQRLAGYGTAALAALTLAAAFEVVLKRPRMMLRLLEWDALAVGTMGMTTVVLWYVYAASLAIGLSARIRRTRREEAAAPVVTKMADERPQAAD